MKKLIVSAIQWGSWPGADPAARRERLESLVREAADRGTDLVVFPRLAGNVAFGDGLSGLQADLALAARSFDDQLQWFRHVAQRFGVQLAGAVLQKGPSGWLETGVIVTPRDGVAGRSVRVHVRSEAGRLNGGDEIEPVDLPWGRVGLLIADDAWSPEQCRILALAGCDLLLSLQALSEPHRQWKQVAGLWQLIQQNQVYGVESCLVGGGFAGVSAVMGPCDMQPRFSGYLAQAADSIRDAVVTAELCPEPLQKARKLFPIFRHFNMHLYDREFPRAFSGGDSR